MRGAVLEEPQEAEAAGEAEVVVSSGLCGSCLPVPMPVLGCRLCGLFLLFRGVDARVALWAQSSSRSPDMAPECLSRLLLAELARVYSLGLCWAFPQPSVGSGCWSLLITHTHALILSSQVPLDIMRHAVGSE